ncbi:MAG TPA: multiheme c-type cytochrome [Longimicrobiales bacterium]
MQFRHFRSALVFPFFTIIAVAGCVDEDVVFRDRELFAPVQSAANGFVGYSDSTQNFTVCGNCHIGQQDQWDETAHADAWITLADAPGRQEFCEACHSVSQRGNVSTTAGGWETVKDARYHDVQCESCHGPGLPHVQNPDAVQPLAPMHVDTGLTYGCGECHNGVHHPFVEEWRRSGHSVAVASPAGRAECQQCHRGQQILQAWGEQADYIEKNSTQHLAITCGVCHDPHRRDFRAQLRHSVDVPRIEEHLCARCHNKRAIPDSASSQGLNPHSPESELLIGEAGWFPPGANINPGQILGTHGSERNPSLCTTCHVVKYEITDEATGQFVFNSTGHTFAAAACVNAQGIPVGGDCAMTTAARSFKGCTASGCHGSEAAAASAMATATLRIRTLTDELGALLRVVDPNLDGAGGQIDPRVPTFTVAEGAFFNWKLAQERGEDNADPNMKVAASTVHNPFLIETLLRESINELERAYGVKPLTRVAQITNRYAHD